MTDVALQPLPSPLDRALDGAEAATSPGTGQVTSLAPAPPAARAGHRRALRRRRPALLAADALLGTVVLLVLHWSTGLLPLAFLATVPVWCLLVACTAPLPSWSAVGPLRHSVHAVARLGCALALTGCVLVELPGGPSSAAPALALAGALTTASSGTRAGLHLARAHRRAATGTPPVVVAGPSADLPGVVAGIERRGGLPVHGVVVHGPGHALPCAAAGCTDLAGLAARAKSLGAQAVVVLPSARVAPEELRRLQWDLEGARIPLCVDSGLLDVVPRRLGTASLGDLTVLQVRPADRSGAAHLLVDLGGRLLALLALVALLPVLLLVAVAVRRDSPGPAIFRQVRVGRQGRHFTMYKFRTMTTAAPAVALASDVDGLLFKMHADPRVTRIGRVLRRYSVDELPQLVNVVRGQMSLVGPRPALPDEVAAYAGDVTRRLAAKPGLTGLWQVSGRSDLSWEESVRLDVHYVDNWSPALDLRILCRTVGAVLSHRGAY